MTAHKSKDYVCKKCGSDNPNHLCVGKQQNGTSKKTDHKSKDIKSEIERLATQLQLNTAQSLWLKSTVEQLLQDARIDELKAVYKEIVKNDIAGNVKWYVDDRLTELKGEDNG